MNQDEAERRIGRLEAELQELRARFSALEAHLTPPVLPQAPEPVWKVEDPVPAPPPVMDLVPKAQPPTVKPEPMTPIWLRAAPEPPAPPTAMNHDEIEYKLGINGLLRGGAIVVLAAFLFLAAVMISRGYVTPPVQFAGEILLCLGFIGIGFWKRDEREEFGQLMVGIGSAGLYASFAGAHLYKHLFEGETLVSLYVLLSFLNLGFAHWRASRSFLAIGMLGGFAAAIMPMKESKAVLDACLHFLILIPAMFITLKNRWYSMAVSGWMVSSIALVPLLNSDVGTVVRMGALYANTGVALYVCSRLFVPSEFDKHALLPAAIVFVTGLVGFAVEYQANGTLHLLVLAAVAGGVGALLSAEEKPRNSIWLGALVAAAVFVPMGYRPLVAAYLYSAEAILLGIAALRWPAVSLFGVSLVTYALGLIAYVLRLETIGLWNSSNHSAEVLQLGLLAASVGLIIRFCVTQLSKDVADWALFFGSLNLVGLFMRAFGVVVPTAEFGLNGEESPLLSLAVAALLTTSAAIKFRRLGLLLSAGLLGVVSTSSALIREPSSSPQWLTLGLLFLTVLNAVMATVWVGKHCEDGIAKPVRMAFGALVSVVFVLALQVAGNHQVGSFNEDTIVYLGIGILTVVWTGLALRMRRIETVSLAWVSWIFCIAVSLGAKGVYQVDWLAPSLRIVALGSLVVLYTITPRKESDEGAVTVLCGFAGWILTDLLVSWALTRRPFEMNHVSATTASWVVFAVVLIVAGFRLDRRFLRYFSLAVFGLTLAKVVLIDLSELDSLIRVGILLLLGLGMIGAGYWYILWHRKKPGAADES